jgi:hypothetical protein
MRVSQPAEARGSLKWFRVLVESAFPTALDEQLREAGAIRASDRLTWQSPLRKDDWAEYRDADFLKKLGLEPLSPALEDFWPERGPQWDALATVSDGTVFLFEGKAHVGEMASTCKAEDEGARTKITRSIAETKAAYGALDDANWLSGFYQYANRLAHLYFLRKHDVRAMLVFVYFMGDQEMRGPSSRTQWEERLTRVHRHLGLMGPIPGLVNAFVPVDAWERITRA